MLRRNRKQRAGFSLIELLVVIAIIAVLMSLLLAAVMKALDVGPRADTTSRIAAINNGIGTFKSSQSYGQPNYIPPGRWEPVANPTTAPNGPGWYPFRLRNQYQNPTGPAEPGIYSFEAQYLNQVFGGGRGLNWVDLGMGAGSTWGADLDANQTLTFFLAGLPVTDGQGNAIFTGFSSNPQRPFIPATPNETRRGPVLDLGGKRKYQLGANGFAYLIDGFGNPFVYFAAYDGKTNKFYGGYNPLAPGVIPYSRGGQFENSSGFQLISAGKNGAFGMTGNWAAMDQAGQDDQANFSDRLLGAGPK